MPKAACNGRGGTGLLEFCLTKISASPSESSINSHTIIKRSIKAQRLPVKNHPQQLSRTLLKMGGGNGAKSAQKRERAAKNAGKEAKSQLKVNETAKDIQCKVCFSTFLKTSRAPAYANPLLPIVPKRNLKSRDKGTPWLTNPCDITVSPNTPRTSTPSP
ncbi:hypothetical protein FJTKL_08260 [Diaporthe vaccinii]|uniref:Small EDRK-rich factor-like N-terminal domain-containing protein n=1 Tax=Diaporthe vaccinii TaxID=105482 RepID=A0ABR4ESA8_9PEZI